MATTQDFSIEEIIFDSGNNTEKIEYMREIIRHDENNNNLALFEHLLSHYEFENKNYNKFLRHCCIWDKLEMFKVLLELGKDKCSLDHKDYKCLRNITYQNSMDILEYLVSEKIVDIQTVFLKCIQSESDVKILKYCKDHGVDFNKIDKYNLDPQHVMNHLLVTDPNYDIVLFLLDNVDMSLVTMKSINSLFTYQSIQLTSKLISMEYKFPEDITWLSEEIKIKINKRYEIPTLLCVVSDTKLPYELPGAKLYYRNNKYYYGYPATGDVNEEYIRRVNILKAIGDPKIIEFK